jgi:hypothetical protein
LRRVAPFVGSGRKCCALLLFVSVASGASASSVAEERRKAAIKWSEPEEKMRMLSITELMRLDRRELLEIEAEFTAALIEHSEGSHERSITVSNLQNIRYVKNSPHPSP